MRVTAVDRVKSIAISPGSRRVKAYFVADAIRRARNYRWVGIYDVGADNISAIAWAGPAAPTHPIFPISAGVNGRALHDRRTVIVSNVVSDADYLATLASTKSEMVVPVFAATENIVGTIDIESDHANAFTSGDARFVEDCARAAAALWC